MKGVSPVVATVLLVLVAIASAGIGAVYLSRVRTRAETAGEVGIVYPKTPPQASSAICYPGYGKLWLADTTGNGINGTIYYMVKNERTGEIVKGNMSVNITGNKQVVIPVRGDVGDIISFRLYTPYWELTDSCMVRKDRNLVLWLKFDEGSGNVAHDFSGNEEDATIYYHTQIIVDWLGANNYDRPIYGSGTSKVSQQMGPFLKNGTLSGTNNLVLRMYKVGNPTGNFIVRFSTQRDSGGVTISYPAENLPTSSQYVYFTLPSMNITEGNTYYVTVEYTGGDSSNYIVWRCGNNRDWASGMSGYAWFGDNANTSVDMSVKILAKTIGWVEGKHGMGIEFDGHNTFVRAPKEILSSIGENKTIIAWVYPHTNKNMGIFQTTDAGWGTNGYAFCMTSNRDLKFRIGDGNTAEEKYSTGNKVELNKWNQVAIAYDADHDQVHFYINGKFSGSGVYTTILEHAPGGSAMIGNEDGFSGEYAIDGVLDEVLIYDRTLTGEEIRALYEAYAG